MKISWNRRIKINYFKLFKLYLHAGSVDIVFVCILLSMISSLKVFEGKLNS